MQVNNEIGTVQPVAELAARAHEAGALFLCDAVQGYGKMTAPADADLIAISAHKIYGPKGIGALWVRDGVALAPLIHGGGQEQGLRSGTLSPALCAGFGAAAVVAREEMAADAAHVETLWTAARGVLSRWTVNGCEQARWRGNLNVRRDGLDVARLMSDLRGLAFFGRIGLRERVGTDQSCAQGAGTGRKKQAKSSIRLGFGRYSTLREIEDACAMIDEAAAAQGV
ncbi:aminotransferase class V-fold PLP-dependent enzyme [Novosphingobium colocasiae]